MGKAFPAITVHRIDTRESVTGMSDDADASIVQPDISDLTPDVIKDLAEDRDKLMYDLIVKASTETMARTRAKMFVRLKNPFELSDVTIANFEKKGEGSVWNEYSILVGITKS